MKLLAERHSSAVRANPRPAGHLSRRRLVVLLGVSAGALATLAGCGEEEKLTRDNYNFPGAKKDEHRQLPDAQRPIAPSVRR